MTLKAKGSGSQQAERKLLNSVWGEVPPGEITAIMGPSGAGEFSIFPFFHWHAIHFFANSSQMLMLCSFVSLLQAKHRYLTFSPADPSPTIPSMCNLKSACKII